MAASKTDSRTKSELADARQKLTEAYKAYAETWDPRLELLEAARAGDKHATRRCDALFENWRYE